MSGCGSGSSGFLLSEGFEVVAVTFASTDTFESLSKSSFSSVVF